MNVLVTGGAGYVGSTLVGSLLARGHHVRVLDAMLHGVPSLLAAWAHPDFEFRRGDVRDADAVRQALHGIDGVVHLAAIVGDPACARQPDLAREVNLDASLGLIAQCRAQGVARIVFASTCSNYGRMTDPDGLVNEDSELRPVSLYAETKVAVEQALLQPESSNGLCTTVLRLATVFGVSPRMRFDLTVNEFTAEMLLNQHLVVFGEQFWRPYVHVTDVARAIGLALDAPRDIVHRAVFNVGATEQNFQKQQLVEMIRALAPAATVDYVHRDEDPRDYRVSFALIQSRLGFRTQKSVNDGIHEVADLLRNGVVSDFRRPEYRN